MTTKKKCSLRFLVISVVIEYSVIFLRFNENKKKITNYVYYLYAFLKCTKHIEGGRGL